MAARTLPFCEGLEVSVRVPCAIASSRMPAALARVWKLHEMSNAVAIELGVGYVSVRLAVQKDWSLERHEALANQLAATLSEPELAYPCEDCGEEVSEAQGGRGRSTNDGDKWLCWTCRVGL